MRQRLTLAGLVLTIFFIGAIPPPLQIGGRLAPNLMNENQTILFRTGSEFCEAAGPFELFLAYVSPITRAAPYIAGAAVVLAYFIIVLAVLKKCEDEESKSNIH